MRFKIETNWRGRWEDFSDAHVFSDKAEAEMNLENLEYLTEKWQGYQPDATFRIVEIQDDDVTSSFVEIQAAAILSGEERYNAAQ